LLRVLSTSLALFTNLNIRDGPDGLDGLALAQAARELRPDLRVLYTTGGAQTDGMAALFVDGAGFLQKPYTQGQLIDTLDGLSLLDAQPLRQQANLGLL
jgi:hypothetical protein